MSSDTPKRTLNTRMCLRPSVRFVASERAGVPESESRDTELMLVLCLIIAALLLPLSNAVGSTAVEQKELYKVYAHTKLLDHKQYLCLEKLWTLESHWSSRANNVKSSAYGIAQLLHTKEANPFKQIDKGLTYITKRYGNCCNAYAYHSRHGNY